MRRIGTTALFLAFWAMVVAGVCVEAGRQHDLEVMEALQFRGDWTPIDEALAIENNARAWEAARAEALRAAGW